MYEIRARAPRDIGWALMRVSRLEGASYNNSENCINNSKRNNNNNSNDKHKSRIEMNNNNLKELAALPQGRWFTCALGGGSNADGLKARFPGSVFVDSLTDSRH